MTGPGNGGHGPGSGNPGGGGNGPGNGNQSGGGMTGPDAGNTPSGEKPKHKKHKDDSQPDSNGN
jgi:hypothetical protein